MPSETPTRFPVTPTETPTALPPPVIIPGEINPDEPVFIIGDIPYTSPFFVNLLAEPFVLLEDQAGFVHRDRDFIFRLESQSIGPVEILDDGTLRYSLALPSVPQGTFVDVDNDGEEGQGVQVFAVAYWSNIWGGPFLEPRDGYGWSGGHVSTIVDVDRQGEIEGGILVVWSPDEQQAFPSGFGDDEMLFTEDDPTASIPAGYTLVDLDTTPFRFYKEARPEITLYEGSGELNDYSNLSYVEAFDSLFEKVAIEYPFTVEKNVDWEGLYEEFAPQIAAANSDMDFFLVMQSFSLAIPDGHVGISFDAQVFFDQAGGSFGLRLAELSDGRVIVIDVLPGESGAQAGIRIGAELLEWDGQTIQEALDGVDSLFGPYSTRQHQRPDQLTFLTRYPPGTTVIVTFRNPDEADSQSAQMIADVEYDSLFDSIPSFGIDELALPIEGEILANGLGYIQITTFSDDYNLMARIWERYLETLNELEVPGLIIDVRINGGGSGGLARDFAGYFFDREIEISRRSYYNELTGNFEYVDFTSTLEPGPFQYEGEVVVLIGPNCVSACEGFAYMMAQGGRATLVGHSATAGAYGEVGQGQYKLPGDYSMQFPTGRPETPSGELLIEGSGVAPAAVVPVTDVSALGQIDAVLEAGVQILLDALNN